MTGFILVRNNNNIIITHLPTIQHGQTAGAMVTTRSLDK